MTSTPDLSTIASKLSEAQRAMIIAAEPYGVFTLIRFPNGVRPNGWRTGKHPISLYWNPQYDSLTRLGLDLLSYLKEQAR